jgi:ribosomal protein L12E/L44/L45/RPP1/RPP2
LILGFDFIQFYGEPVYAEDDDVDEEEEEDDDEEDDSRRSFVLFDERSWM